MSTNILQVYSASSGGTQDGLASIDIPVDGVITGIDVAVEAALNADGEVLHSELSFISSNQLSTNDARGIITAARAAMGLLTSGASVTQVNKFVGPMNLQVAGGERIYLNVVATAGVIAQHQYLIHLEPSRAVTRRSARRTTS